jgi:hypothetical protein
MSKVIGKIEYKNVFKVFFAWQEKKEEDWLRQMSKEGWHLNKVGFFNYEFIKGEPKDIIYKFDYKPFRSEKIDDYITLFEDSGWEYVAKFAGWFYFRTEAKGNFNLELYNDNASKIRKYITLRWILIIACAPVVYNLPNLFGRIIRTLRSDIVDDILARTLIINFSVPLTVFLVLALSLIIFGIIRISIIIRRIRLDIRE